MRWLFTLNPCSKEADTGVWVGNNARLVQSLIYMPEDMSSKPTTHVKCQVWYLARAVSALESKEDPWGSPGSQPGLSVEFQASKRHCPPNSK